MSKENSPQTTPEEVKRLSVLVVEDDDVDFGIIERHLASRRNEYILKRADSLESALALLQVQHFDVGLIDYSLGDGEGIELIEALGGIEAPFPLIVLTGLEHADIDEVALKAGAVDFLPKVELTRELIRRSLKYAIKQFETRNQLRHAKRIAETNSRAAKEFFATVGGELGKIRELLAELKGSTNIGQASGAGALDEFARLEMAITRLLANCDYVSEHALDAD